MADISKDNKCASSRTPPNNDMVQMDELPDEIIEFILTYLPPYLDLERCRLVCKRWNAIVKNLIRRSKLNLHKGLIEYRLVWEVFTQQTTNASANNSLPYSSSSSSASSSQSSHTYCSNTLQSTPMIAGRFSHSAVFHANSMYIFGGGSSSDTTFNDLWRFDLSEMRWERPLSMGSYPSPKGSASMVSWNSQLVLFGGWRYPSLHPPYQPWCLFDELHYYDLGTHRWSVRTAFPSPPPMAGHSATVHRNCMVVFGGYQISEGVNNNSNETWCLDLTEYKWTAPRILGNTKPPPRYGQFQVDLDENHLLIVGGCGGPNSIHTDAWVLDMSKDVWSWRAIPVRNKKFGALHMWCNPSCKVGSKLVVLGTTPNLPQDFQIMKHTRIPGGGGMPAPRLGAVMGAPHNHNARARPQRDLVGAPLHPPVNHNRLDNFRMGGAHGGLHAHGPDEQYFANRRAILNQHQHNVNNNVYNNNHLQPRIGRLSELHGAPAPAPAIINQHEERNQNRVSASPRLNGVIARNDNEGSSVSGAISGAPNNLNDIEAANRLQRNLAMRCRDNEPLLPKRFDEMYDDPFRMAAFNVQNRPRSVSKDHNERIRRMEEKMMAIRNSRRNALAEQKIKEPSPKRIKRNVLSLFVCDLAAALDPEDPHLQWIEYKNYGIIPGAPERLILSSMVAGHGELILFGGVHKETLSEITHQVSNSVHFLSAPRDIV